MPSSLPDIKFDESTRLVTIVYSFICLTVYTNKQNQHIHK